MRTYNHLGIVLVAACSVAVCWGCKPAQTPDKQKPPQGQVAGGGEQGKPKEDSAGEKPPRKLKPKVVKPTEPTEIPPVVLTKENRETCLVFDGDPLPEAELPDLEGNTQTLDSLYGEELSIVCFWKVGESEFDRLRSAEILGILEKDYGERYAEKGLRVIGVNVGEPAEAVRPLLDQAGAKFPNLLDRQGELFAKVATKKVPRIYLLDAEGKIVWFDLECSRQSREKLTLAIVVSLKKSK